MKKTKYPDINLSSLEGEIINDLSFAIIDMLHYMGIENNEIFYFDEKDFDRGKCWKFAGVGYSKNLYSSISEKDIISYKGEKYFIFLECLDENDILYCGVIQGFSECRKAEIVYRNVLKFYNKCKKPTSIPLAERCRQISSAFEEYNWGKYDLRK